LSRPKVRTTFRRVKQLTTKPTIGVDISRMLKRRLKAAGQPDHFAPHSFRAATVTGLLEQNVPLDDG
jgi:hypothetical protein